MKKGHLVNPIASKSHMAVGPYIVVRGPYEFSAVSIVKGKRLTQLIRCVDLLDPSGGIVKHVACEILERV